MQQKSLRIAAIIAMLLAGVALQGCGTSGGPAPAGIRLAPTTQPTPCNVGICTIKVTVSNCEGQGGITVDKPYLSVSVARNMRWVIDTPGYEFAPNGIQFDPPNAQFVVQPSLTTSEFRIRNLKTQAGDFYYYINVDGCRQADPWIKNN